MDFDVKQLALSIRALAEEKNLPEEVVKDVVEQALAAAYRRDYGDRDQEVRVEMNVNTGEVVAFITKEVVANKPETPAYEISLSDASVMQKSAKVGDQIEVREEVKSFGRVAAQTAKQVILQRLREAEREVVMTEFEDKIGTVINAIVSRVEGPVARLEIGKAQGIMPRSEQIQGERYYPGQRIKVYLKDVERGPRGPQLVVSRGNTEFVEWLFRNEVPEMEGGAVVIKQIAREAGVRTKMAVASTVPGVDPVGTFVGGHGTRVNAVTSEIGDQERIDIIVFNSNPVEYIKSALSPAEVSNVKIEGTRARVQVPEDQLSVAIGRSGQNVRLASKLTGYEIDVESANRAEESSEKSESTIKPTEAREAKKASQSRPKIKKKSDLESSLIEAIEEHGE